ncbi:MAG: hypothetical protein EU536_04060 [Promethearchaeota archaeon]|nr:MAG: hypothetical protein EU536_04060 [Candidatus Lokiarchaeota archaeon]
MTSLLKSFIDDIPTTPSTICSLLEEMHDIFSKEPNLINIGKSPLLFIGDTHGNFQSTSKISAQFLMDDDLRLVFLGDYVDRGEQQLENVLLLFLLKHAYPDRIILLRGNHEEEQMNRDYGFQHLLSKQFGNQAWGVFNQFQRTFAQLPLCVMTWNRTFGVHGGIPISMQDKPITLKEIAQRERGATNLEEFDFITAQLLWNDPKEDIQGYTDSARGIGFFFGRDLFEEFINQNNISTVIRSHEVFQNGYKYFFDKQLISIFSALDYVYIRGIAAKMVRISLEGTIKLQNIAD